MTHQLIARSEVTTKKGDKWEATMIINDGMYQGLITKNGCKEYESSRAYSEANVKRWLNTNIARLNTQYEIKPPIATISYNVMKRQKGKVEAEKSTAINEPVHVENIAETAAPSETAAPQEQPKAPAKEKRKPFTPYGLNGYLVDKNGNIRLMLDRKASAHTIVLNSEMFNALAEMVHRTQTQGEAT